MKPSNSFYTQFHNKSFCVQNIKSHIDTISLSKSPNQDGLKFLWATKVSPSNFNIKTISTNEDVKNILISSSSTATSSIRRIFDQLQFECNKKFGGSNILIEKLIIKLSQAFLQNQNNIFPSVQMNDWIKILFEEVVPMELGVYAIPNNLEGFARASVGLYDVYPVELVRAVLEAILEAGSGGSMMVKQSHFDSYKVVGGKSGYKFTTFQPSKVFVGLKKYQEKGITFNNPKILLVNGAVEDFSEIEEILEMSYSTKQPVIILADRISDEVFETIRMNLDDNDVECFAAEVVTGYDSLNTINDVGVVIGNAPITPLTMYSEFLMAKWDELGEAQEMTFYRNGAVAIKKTGTEQTIKAHLKHIAAQRAALTMEDFATKEPICTKRIKNLTANSTTLYVPYKTQLEGETLKLQVDSIIRYLKSVISYGILDLTELEPYELLTKLKNKIPEEQHHLFDEASWFFFELFKLWQIDNIPYIYLSGASRLALTQLTLLFSAKGIVTLSDQQSSEAVA